MVNCNDYVLERVEIHNCFPAGKNEVISILQYFISIFQASKHRGAILELSQNAPKGHFGIKLECTEGPFWHIYRAVWAKGPFGLDNISWSDLTLLSPKILI